MIFVDEINDCEKQHNCIPTDKNKEKLDAVQTAVDGLNEEVLKLSNSVAAFDTSLHFYQKTSDRYTDKSIERVKDEIASDIASSVNTNQLLADFANVNNLTVGTSLNSPMVIGKDIVAQENLTAEAASIENAEIANAEIANVSAESADIEVADISTLTATHAAISDLHMTDVDAETVSADTIEADSISSKVAEITKLISDIVTNDESNYLTLEGVDNTQLSKLSIPAYNGIVNIIEENNDFNITIIDNSIVAYNQAKGKEYIRRINISREKTDIYFENIGDTFYYRPLFIGSEDTVEVEAETIDNVGMKFNIARPHGIVIYGDTGTGNGGLNYLITEELPDYGVSGYIYVVLDDNAYIFDTDTDTFIPFYTDAKEDEIVTPAANINFAALLS